MGIVDFNCLVLLKCLFGEYLYGGWFQSTLNATMGRPIALESLGKAMFCSFWPILVFSYGSHNPEGALERIRATKTLYVC